MNVSPAAAAAVVLVLLGSGAVVGGALLLMEVVHVSDLPFSQYFLSSLLAPALPESYSGATAIDFTSCTVGYAQGGCNEVDFAWSATLMAPQAAASVWNAKFAHVSGYIPIGPNVTCGFGALYQTDLPAYSPTQAKYVPFAFPAGVGTWLVVSSVVYLQSDSEYTCPNDVGVVYSSGTFTATTVTTAINPAITVTNATAATTSSTAGAPANSGVVTTLPSPPSSPVPGGRPGAFVDRAVGAVSFAAGVVMLAVGLILPSRAAAPQDRRRGRPQR